MKKILILKNSILQQQSESNKIVDYIRTKFSDSDLVTEHNFGEKPLPYFDFDSFMGVRQAPENELQQQRRDLSDNLINELNEAELLIITIPAYNLTFPAQLKSYFDYIIRPGVSLTYVDDKPQGLLRDKKTIVILPAANFNHAANNDLITPFVEQILNLVGIRDIHFIYIEGIGKDKPFADNAKQQALEYIDKLFI